MSGSDLIRKIREEARRRNLPGWGFDPVPTPPPPAPTVPAGYVGFAERIEAHRIACAEQKATDEAARLGVIRKLAARAQGLPEEEDGKSE